MKVSVLGRGNVGGGLADLWEQAAHDVTRLGRDGGDVSDADAVLIAVPGGAVPDALGKIAGVDGKIVIDATNLVRADPPEGFASNAEFIKSRVGGPTAKSFNTNFMALLPRLGEPEKRPSNIWCGDEAAREVVERLITDAGYEPVYAGGLENAAVQENFLKLEFAILQAGTGPFFYRIAPPDKL